MNKKIKKRVLFISDYIISTGSTIRAAAKKFGVSKSTIHNDISKRLIKLDIIRYCEVQKIMKYHLQIRHINGGESTKMLFLSKQK